MSQTGVAWKRVRVRRGRGGGGRWRMLDIKKFQKMSKNLQAGMETMKTQLAGKTVDGASGGGVVTVKVNGNQELVEIQIKPEAVDPSDIEMLQDLILAAVNQAIERSKDLQQESINQLTGGMKLPNLPFF
jgi:DNA-binding YbaB/EbfC family protein